MRSLSAEDRDAYLDAMREIYELSDAAGRARYGANFRSGAYFTAKHASADFCFHGNLAFLTTHPAFTLELERSLRSVNASVAATYWDFTRDHALGAGWVRAAPYTDEWFGSVDNGAADGYRPRGGRFAQVATVYDPNRTWTRAHHNAFGFLASEENPMNSRVLQRTAGCAATRRRSRRVVLAARRVLRQLRRSTPSTSASSRRPRTARHERGHVGLRGRREPRPPPTSPARAGARVAVFATITDVVGKYPKCAQRVDYASLSRLGRIRPPAPPFSRVTGGAF